MKSVLACAYEWWMDAAFSQGLKPLPFVAFMYGLKPVPFKTAIFICRVKPVPFKAAIFNLQGKARTLQSSDL